MLLMAVVLSLLLGRLVQLQGLDASAYAAAAAENRLKKVTLPATRGTITDTHGVALATTVEAINVTVDQQLVAQSERTDAEQMAAQLAPLLKMEAATIEERLTGDRRFAYVAKDVTPQTWREINELDPRPEGLFPERYGKRVYPGGALAGNVVGFAGADGKGAAGVEYALQDVLAGKHGSATFERSPDGREIPAAQNARVEPVPGQDVQLTIDRDIQWYAQDAIAGKVAEVEAESGTVVVYDARSGDVLAMATAPTVDPNRPGSADAADRGNRPTQESFEPGSTGKLLTAAAAIEEGAVTPDTVFSVPNRLERGGKSFKDWYDHETLELTFAGVIARSSNIGTMLAAERMGLEKMHPYFEAFGVGQPLDLALPENPGALLHPDDWSATTPYTMAFGQGYAVNALQLTAAVGAIANDGVRVEPRLIEAYIGEDGTRRDAPAPQQRRVVSQETAQTVQLLMEGVLAEDGTAPATAIPGYRVGGKTGTANRYDEEVGHYRGFTMSYIGIAPADDPALVVGVWLQNPKSGGGGGSTAGPVFTDVMSFALQSERIPPTGAEPPAVTIYAD